MTVVAVVMTLGVVFAAPKKQNISVLYVGGSAEFDTSFGLEGHTQEEFDASVKARMAAWESFLKEYFKTVEVVHADNYTEQMSDQYDVTIFDGHPTTPLTPKYQNRRKGDYFRATYLSQN